MEDSKKTIEPNNSFTEFNREESNISQNSKYGTEDVKKENATELAAMATKPNTIMRPPSRIPETVRSPIAPRDNIITPPITSRMYRLQPTPPNRSHGPIKPFGIFPKKSGDSINSEMQMNARDRVAENNRLKVFESLYKKIRDMQTEFLSKFATLKLSSPDKIKDEYKLISVVKNDECKLMVHDDFLTKFPKSIPSESVGDLRQKINTSMDEGVMNLEKVIRTYAIKDQKFGSKMEEPLKNLKANKERRLQEINEYITELSLQYHDDNIDALITNLTKELQVTKQLLQDSEDRMLVQINVNEQEKADLKAKITEEFNDMICKKEQELEEMQLKAVELELINEEFEDKVEKLETEEQENQKEIATLEMELKSFLEKEKLSTRKINELERLMLKEKEEKLAKVTIIENLSADLEAALEKIKEEQFQQKQSQTSIEELVLKVRQQKESLDSYEKQTISIQSHMDKLKADAENVVLFKKQLGQSKIRIEELEQDILKLNTAIETLTVEYNTELNKLSQSAVAKIRELKSVLPKCKRAISQLKAEKLLDRQMLKVRTELINSMQKEYKDQRNQLATMSAELIKKDNNIREIITELQAKSEELRNLVKTLKQKDSELAQQTQLNNLLMDCNNRHQKVRVRQESKVSKMEDEIIHLKESIANSQADVRDNQKPPTTRIDLTTGAASTPAQDDNENVETPDRAQQFRDGRNRKRKIKIKVKQYQI